MLQAINIYLHKYLHTYIHIDIYIYILSGRPGFNPRSSHSKDSKNGC